MIKVKFMRYTASGADEATIEIPSDNAWMKDGYSTFPLTKRHRVWADKQNKFDFGNHVIGLMLNDDDFVRSYVPTWALKGLRKYTSNLYVFFSNGEDGEVVESKSKAEKKAKKVKKERKPREKKVNPEKEKKMTFKALRNKLNGKIKLTKALHHWTDPALLQYYNNSQQTEEENFMKVVLNIFNSYKLFVEELLTSRKIPFYVAAQNITDPPNRSDSYGYLHVEYVLVNNTENVPVGTMNKQDFDKLTLAWFSTNKIENRENRWERNVKKYLSIKKIGLAYQHHNSRSLRKSDVKAIKSMRESAFAEVVEKVLTANTTLYNAKVEDFKAMKSRVVTNKVELEKLGGFITTNIIPLVDAAYLEGNTLKFEKENFKVRIAEKNSYRNLEVLNIGFQVDDVENLTINVEFFDNKTISVHTADDAINVINTVFGNAAEFQTMMTVFSRAWKVK